MKLRRLLLAGCLLCSALANAYGQLIPRSFLPNPLPSPLLPIARDGKMGYINREGKIVIEPQFDEAWSFGEGAALVLTGSKWGYIDKSGEFIWGPTK